MTETLVTCLTPSGTGAIATIAVRGLAAWQLARALFRPRSDSGAELPETPGAGNIWLGRFGEDAADEVVLAVKVAEPLSWVEVHCHGGRQVVCLLLETLERRGARVCDMAEFFRSLLPPDPLRDLAQERLLLAPTARTVAILLRECHGGFRVTLQTILSSLDGQTAAAAMLLGGLLRGVPVGRHLIEPWRVTLAGAPNVGKSSLLNALAGYQRSVVSPTPGTTRDVVTTTTALDGWPVELADTAGVREAAGALEGQGIDLARRAAASADLCLWVLDAAAEPAWPDLPPQRVLLVVNKVDLPAMWDLCRAQSAVHVSARTGTGIPELCDAIVRRLVPSAPSSRETVPFTPALCDRIEEAHAHAAVERWGEVRRVLEGLLAGVW